MKRFKRFFGRLHGGRLRKVVLSTAILLSFACGDYIDPGKFMSFFQPEVSNARPEDRRYFFTPQLYNTDEIAEQYATVVVDENVKAWSAYLGGSLPDTIVSKALYDEAAGAVQRLTDKLEPTNAPAMAYLEFAWAADDESEGNGSNNPWNTDTVRVDKSKQLLLLNKAKTDFQTVADPFLKERYAFQTVKLACEVGDYKQARQVYDQLVRPLAKKTFISDWALCRRAGASLALGDTAQAIYEFAQVFDRCPSRRKAAETSLRKYGIRFRKDALKYARTDGERAAVYALCAIQPGQDALVFLKEIVRLTPENPLVELIMAREINRNEYYFFTTYQDYTYDGAVVRMDSSLFATKKASVPSYFDQLREFALESAENKALVSQHHANGSPGPSAFWYTAAAYLDYLGKEYKAAQTHLDQAAVVAVTNEPLKKQIALQRMLLLAALTASDERVPISIEVEKQLIGYLEEFGKSENFRFNNAFNAVCQEFTAKYRQTANTKSGWLASCSRSKAEPNGASLAKAYLLTLLPAERFVPETNQYVIDDDTISVATVQQLIQYARQPTLADFDKRLLKLANMSEGALNLLLGRRLMAEHRYAEAADAFARLDPATWKTEAFLTYFQRNPFAVQMPRLYAPARTVVQKSSVGKVDSTLVPSVNFPAEVATSTYTPITFARRMAELEKRAKEASGDEAAELYYQLGCGAWNMSWYGNTWLAQRASWSAGELYVYTYSADQAVNQKRFDALLATDYYTTDRARAYFDQAKKAAKTPSVADRAAYMAARSEAHHFAVHRAIEQLHNGYVSDDDPAFVKRMALLRQKEYSRDYTDFVHNHTKTGFHDEMIRQCPLYSDFLSFEKRIGSPAGE